MLNRVTITEIGSGKLKAFGNKRRFTAQAVDLDGYPILGKVASWKSSNEAVASIDATGEATAKQNGTVTLIASVEDQFAGATLVVDQELASVLSLTGEGKLTALNRGRQYKAVDANGNSIVGKNLAWASSSDAVASVDQAGLAKARGNGIAKISATVDGKSLSADLEVSQEVASLQVTSDSTGKLTALKRQRKFTANAKDPDGYDITSKVVVWSSSDPTIASIDGTGVATAQRNGKIKFRAAIDGFQSPPVDLEIQQVLAAILSIDGSGKLKSKGETRQFAAADAGGSALSNPITWRIMGDPAVATIDANGKLTATKNRKTTVTATDGSVSVSTDVEVEQMAARIVITKGKTTLPGVRKQTTFEAIAYDANSYVVEDKVIAWSVSNPAVATITTSGDVISVSTGVTKIRASMDSVTTEVDLTVN